NPRHRTRYGSEARARAAAVLLLTLRGTPFLYAGEELGLEDAVVPSTRAVDPGGRDGCRAPMPWDGGTRHGWASARPWLPWPPDAARRNRQALRDDASSTLQLYRRVLAARRRSRALRLGDFRLQPSPDGVLGWERRDGDERRVVLVNFGSAPVGVPIPGDLRVEVSTHASDEGLPYRGTLAGDQAVILSA